MYRIVTLLLAPYTFLLLSLLIVLAWAYWKRRPRQRLPVYAASSPGTIELAWRDQANEERPG